MMESMNEKEDWIKKNIMDMSISYWCISTVGKEPNHAHQILKIVYQFVTIWESPNLQYD